MSNLKVNQIEYHRNGSVGPSFWAVSFTASEYECQFIATIFSEDGNIAVLSLDQDGKPELSRGWRGHYFESELRAAVAAFEENGFKLEKETPKVGYYAYHDDEADLIVKALDKSNANRKASELEIEVGRAEMEVFDTEEEAQHYLDTFALKSELEQVQDRLNRSSRMPADEFDRLRQRLDDLQYELQGR